MQLTRKQCESGINKAVDDYWANVLARNKELKAFNRKCDRTIGIGAGTIALSSTSIYFSLGVSAPLSLVVIARACVSIAKTLQKQGRSINETELILKAKIKEIEKLLEHRNRQKGQKLNKTKEGLKELAATVFGPITEKIITTTAGTEALCNEYSAKVKNMEDDAGKMYSQIQKYTKEFPSDPKGFDKKQIETMKIAQKTFEKMTKAFEILRRGINEKKEYAKSAKAICKDAKEKDKIVAGEKKLLDITEAAGGLVSMTLTMLKLVAKLA